MTGTTKAALLIVDTDKGERMVAALSDDYAPVRQAALAAQSRGTVEVDGKAHAITGGFILCSWRSPAVAFRFRCEPKAAKPKK
jgi:hypothetical protein